VKIHYKVVEHDGGWAYKLGDVFSEAFPDRAAALTAAKRAAAEQHVPGEAAYIEYQDEAGRWHTEFSAGDDRPDADVIRNPADCLGGLWDSAVVSGAIARGR